MVSDPIKSASVLFEGSRSSARALSLVCQFCEICLAYKCIARFGSLHPLPLLFLCSFSLPIQFHAIHDLPPSPQKSLARRVFNRSSVIFLVLLHGPLQSTAQVSIRLSQTEGKGCANLGVFPFSRRVPFNSTSLKRRRSQDLSFSISHQHCISPVIAWHIRNRLDP